MRHDLGMLRISKMIVHEVPKRYVHGGNQITGLSEIESPLPDDIRHFFEERIKISLASAAYDVMFDLASPSPIPKLVLDNLGQTSSDFVEMSKTMARHLYECQTAVNPAGLLAVAQATIGSHGSIVILKLEKESGVRVRQAQIHGLSTFNMEHVRDLMLTERTKIFKVGLFVQEGDALATIVGRVSDKQRGLRPTVEVADFFLRRFLGCCLREAPDITTKRFFQATQEYINERVANPVLKGRYEIALLATLGCELPSVNPQDFAEQHLRGKDKDAYINFLHEKELDIQPFQKDTTLIEPHLARMRLDFQSGIALLGPLESFQDHVLMSDIEEGRVRVMIEDRLKTIGAKL